MDHSGKMTLTETNEFIDDSTEQDNHNYGKYLRKRWIGERNEKTDDPIERHTNHHIETIRFNDWCLYEYEKGLCRSDSWHNETDYEYMKKMHKTGVYNYNNRMDELIVDHDLDERLAFITDKKRLRNLMCV